MCFVRPMMFCWRCLVCRRCHHRRRSRWLNARGVAGVQPMHDGDAVTDGALAGGRVVSGRRREDTGRMTTSERWVGAIEDVCAEPDPARCNQLITRLHYLL